MPDEQARWARVREIVDRALESGPEERHALVVRACGGDTSLEEEVESLLDCSGETSRLDRCLVDAVQSAVAEHSTAPERIGPYRIERVLGSGGMGTVYLGVREDDQLPARVAIKVTHSGGENLLERFRSERRILAGLIHPYIARLLDAGRLDDGRPYFVMEYVDGRPIDQYVADVQPPVLELFLKVCAAVQFAHQNLVIHRDLKAGNILVTETGDPRLLDFGIAKLMAGDREARMEETLPWDRMLTPAAASPEQASGGPVTMASDVYSLGVLLYRLLTGASPYAGAKEFTQEPARVIREYEPPLASAAPGVNPRVRRQLAGDLDNILRKALEKDPARRYPTAHELAADIERHLKGLPVEARPASFSYRAAKFVRRNRLAVTAAGLLALSVTAGAVASLEYAHRARLQQLRAEREFSSLRKLTHSFLFEIDDAIGNLTGATAVHELVVRRSIEYLDQLAAEAGDDTVVLNDLAEGYTRIAKLLGTERHARPEMSPESATETGLKGLAIRRRLLAINPGDVTAIRNLQDSLWAVASFYLETGDYQRALALQQERLQLTGRIPAAQRTTDDDFHLGDTLTAISEYQWRMGQYDQALETAGHALEVRQRILDSNPPSSRALRSVAISHEFVGYVFFQQEDYRASAGEHRAALTAAEAALKLSPNSADRQRLVAVAHESLCESLALADSAAQALPHCRAAVAGYSKMADADQTDMQAREDVASGESTFSLALERSGEPRQALEWQLRARKLFDAALPRDPASLDLAESNARSLLELADIERQLHNGPAAKAAAERARTGLRELTRRVPQSHTFATLLERAEAKYQSFR